MFISLHLRALSVEYCRKRYVLEFFKQQSRLTRIPSERLRLEQHVKSREVLLSCFQKVYLGSLFNLLGGSDIDSVEYFFIPFSRNLQVSCCGCFDGKQGVFESVIGFNLISYSQMSILVLTNFKAVKHYLDACIKAYPIPNDGERLVNDIAFFHCEEPLMSPRLWLSLDEEDKLKIKLSLRHPHFKTETTAPRIIKLVPSDFLTKFTPDMLKHLSPEFGTT